MRRYKTLEGAQRHCHSAKQEIVSDGDGWRIVNLPKAVARRREVGRWLESAEAEIKTTRSAARYSDLQAAIKRYRAELEAREA